MTVQCLMPVQSSPFLPSSVLFLLVSPFFKEDGDLFFASNWGQDHLYFWAAKRILDSRVIGLLLHSLRVVVSSVRVVKVP